VSGRLANLSFFLVDEEGEASIRGPSVPGDLELVDPWFLLAYFSPGFRTWYDGEGWSRITAGPAEPTIERALGGLEESGEPRDVVFTTEEAADLARALEYLDLTTRRDDNPSQILNWFEDLAADLEGTDSDLDSGASEDTLRAWLTSQVEEVRELYVAAAARGLGVEVRWHANP